MSNEIKVVVSDVNKIITKVNWLSSNDYTSAEKNKVANIPNDTNADLATKASKLFATNLVTNGDFSNGTTGWSSNFGTISIVGGELVYMPTSVSSTARIEQTQDIAIATNKYFLMASIFPKYANATNLHIGNVSSSVIIPTPNIWNKISAIVTANDTTRFRLFHNTSTNYVVGVDTWKADNVLAINLTTLFGSGNEPTKEQMDWLISQKPNSWFNGTTDILGLKELFALARRGLI